MSDNKALWNRVFMTDPRAVKPITGKAYTGNSPKPYHIIERLTDEFGPCGIGWGFTILCERFERFGEGANSEALHIATVRFWYVTGGRRGELEQVGQTRAAYTTSKGKFMVDEDAPKKSVTDALVKCASYLGFAGDIFSGRWDDSHYVQQALAEYEGREREAARQAWLDETAQKLESCATPDELKAVWSAAVATIKTEQDKDAHDVLKPIMERARDAIKARQEQHA
jgi:hypothetical protein